MFVNVSFHLGLRRVGYCPVSLQGMLCDLCVICDKGRSKDTPAGSLEAKIPQHSFTFGLHHSHVPTCERSEEGPWEGRQRHNTQGSGIGVAWLGCHWQMMSTQGRVHGGESWCAKYDVVW